MKYLTNEDFKALVESGTSLETIHLLHGPLQGCPIDEKENIERILSNFENHKV